MGIPGIKIGERSGERVRLDLKDRLTIMLLKFKSGVGIPGIKIGDRSGESVRLDLNKGTES